MCRAVYPAYAQSHSGFTESLFAPVYTLSTLLARRERCAAKRRESALPQDAEKGSHIMNLVVWLPLLFALGLGSLVLCVLFVDACERI